MPINILDTLPAKKVLEKENIFVIGQKRAFHQDIRPLKIAVVNLMPLKINTETQLLRMLSNTPLQVEIELVHTVTHNSHHTPREHLETFYKTFDQIRNHRFDGLIITGAPVEHLRFEKVDYWEELKTIMKWSSKNVTSTLYICWAAQAGLYYHYGIKKYPKERKVFGVYSHHATVPTSPLLRGFDDVYFVPHSRHTEIRACDIQKVRDLEILSESDEAGVHVVASKDGSKIFITGHSEYDNLTLKNEYARDFEKGLPIDIPKNYFPHDDPSCHPSVKGRSHAFLLYSNWLNYYVYQTTPYNWIDSKAT